MRCLIGAVVLVLSACNCGGTVGADGGNAGGGEAGGGALSTGGGAGGGSAGGGSAGGEAGGSGGGLGGGGPGGGSGGGAAGGTGGAIACADRNPLKNLYWGDLHTHTGYSVDAYAFGTRNSPVDAYQFARGAPKQVGAGIFDGGGPITQLPLGRPLDFDAVTDHSEWLAVTYGCGDLPDGGPFDPSSPYYGSATCQFVRSEAFDFGNAFMQQGPLCGTAGSGQTTPDCLAVTKSAWAAEQAAAAAAYDPCHFTSLKAYEWTYSRMGATLHRNVIFGTDVVPDAPFDSIDYNTPPMLFNALAQGCREDAGCKAMAIPHNTNLSDGLAFEITTTTPANLSLYNRYEKLIEIHQHKGSSECYFDYANGTGNALDPLCDFEHKNHGETADSNLSYVRVGMLAGLLHYEDAGVDPFQFGIEAATDDHNGVPGNVAEDTYPGHAGINDDTPDRRMNTLGERRNNPGGVTGVWAEENTREAIYAALERRETLGTSGPRIAVRFYQSWSPTDFCTGGFPGNVIAAGGLPMGSTLGRPPKPDAGLYFVANALKDTIDLAEVDFVKVWVKNGLPHVQVNRFPVDAGTVCMSWQDTAYDSSAPGAWYVRVIEQPTWRWSHYDCQTTDAGVRAAACAADAGTDEKIQERAWTSPIYQLP
jgi:hypothetical protein